MSEEVVMSGAFQLPEPAVSFQPLSPEIVLVTIAGDIIVETYAQVRDALRNLAQDPNSQGIVINMAQVRSIDSAGLALLVECHRHLRERLGGDGRGVILVEVHRRVLRALEMTRIIKLLRTVDSNDAALQVLDREMQLRLREATSEN